MIQALFRLGNYRGGKTICNCKVQKKRKEEKSMGKNKPVHSVYIQIDSVEMFCTDCCYLRH